MNNLLKATIDYCYCVLCRHCNKQMIDPDKKYRQKYTDGICPYCGKNGDDPVGFESSKQNIKC